MFLRLNTNEIKLFEATLMLLCIVITFVSFVPSISFLVM